MTTTKITSALIAMLCISLSFSSCKKDEEEEPAPAPTKKELLSGNNWELTAYSVEPAIDIDQNGTQENNLMPYLQACSLDDFTDLNTDNTYTSEEGPSKCDPNDPQVFESGSWSLNSDETLVIFSPSGQQSYEMSIESLSSSQWEAKQIVVSGGVTYTFSLTFD